ncbi:hypothetical protein PO909_031920 [Leuciscus waleckii]
MASKPHPPLMKKHSQTDLVSRLKTRKILGVGGEDDDGEVHRSKVSICLSCLCTFPYPSSMTCIVTNLNTQTCILMVCILLLR